MRDHIKVCKPIIERYGEDIPIDPYRKKAADDICRYFANRCDASAKNQYYEAVEYLLRHRESARILLYLPFDELADAPKWFKTSYLETWYSLLNRYDVRENFHEGDCFEEDARPNGEIDRVVKCMHLLPWMFQARIITFNDVLDFADINRDDMQILQGLMEACVYMNNSGMLSSDEIIGVRDIRNICPPSVSNRLSPTYISESRKKWLKERENERSGNVRDLLTPNAHLEGPFTPNLRFMKDDVEEIRKMIEPNEVVLIGGSRLKGYGTVDSDFDIWKLSELDHHEYLYPGNPGAIHVYFDTVWIAGDEVTDLAEISREKMNVFLRNGNRGLMLERLESDLLQYRLLHKGFSRVTGRRIFSTSKNGKTIDGDCPFYSEDYRRIATMLFAKYVLLPN